MSSKTTIRNSLDADIDCITTIYAQEVLSGLASFEVEPPDPATMANRRRSILKAGFPYLVATIDDQVVGYAYVGPYRTRPAYKHTLENSVYVASSARGNGVGKKLLAALIDTCKDDPWHSIIAVIGDSDNEGSIALHQSLGFAMVGTLKEAGYKHGTWVDSVLMQKLL